MASNGEPMDEPAAHGQHTSGTDAAVKQEPNEGVALAEDAPRPKIEDDVETVFKTAPSPVDQNSASDPTTSVLPTTEKQRAPPKKKAVVSKKAAPKKRKIELSSKDGTPASQRSATPASIRTDKHTTTKPSQHSPARTPVDDDEDDGGGDEGLFCICRGPDNHTWMIGCDGECEDWFHGRCVNMKQEDSELVDRYICPNCEKKGVGVTTWKPMCRLEGCRKPARVSGPAPSKYCSDEHGREFMRQRVLKKSHRGDEQPAKKRRQVEVDQAAGTLQSKAEVEEAAPAYLRGGYLEPGELKALTDGVKDMAEFKRLGDSILPASGTSEPQRETNMDVDNGPEVLEANDATCVPEEKQHLESVLAKSTALRHQLQALRDKDRFLTLAKARAVQYAAEMVKTVGETKKKDTGKDICGFDSRLSWSNVEFDQWRTSREGRSALDIGDLGPLPGPKPDAMVDPDGDAVMHEVPVEDQGVVICPKRRCERHKTWYKLHQQEIAYDQRECQDGLGKLGAEARAIEERAILRKLEASHVSAREI